MKGNSSWSYRPYKPLISEGYDIYICRVVPGEYSIHFEWLKNDEEEFEVYYRKRNDDKFIFWGKTKNSECDILDLETETDYEFYVQSNGKKSRYRLARCGKSIGTVVNYLHPDDEAYAISGQYLCSPSLVRHPDGYLLASMDLYGPGTPQNLTLIFRSDDDGESWHYVSELMPCFWGKMFIHKGELYMLSVATEYGDLLIGKSTDGGKTFSAPVALLRSSNGIKGYDGVHKNPQNIIYYNDRIYETFEWGNWYNKEYGHSAVVMSCDVNDDLLVPENWSFTEPLKFSHFTEELQYLPNNAMTIEGTLVVNPQGKLLNVMRFDGRGTVIAYEVNLKDPDAPLTYSHCFEFWGNRSKFMMKYDEKSKCYYSIATRIYNPDTPGTRNLLSLMCSEDLEHWEVVCDLFDYRHEDFNYIGFQYVDFEIEGDDIIYLCRTAMNAAHNYHDSNYSTFHRIKDFRKLRG